MTGSESGAKASVSTTMAIADGGYPGIGLVMHHRRRTDEELPDWRQARARVEHVFARMKSWKILRDCRLKNAGVHHATLGIAASTTSTSPDRRAAEMAISHVHTQSKIIYWKALRSEVRAWGSSTGFDCIQAVDGSLTVGWAAFQEQMRRREVNCAAIPT